MTTHTPPIPTCAPPPVAPAPGCSDCGGELGRDQGPRDGMVLKDGSRVCVACLRKIRIAMLANPFCLAIRTYLGRMGCGIGESL